MVLLQPGRWRPATPAEQDSGRQHCLCLWRRFSQMTMTRPWRRMTLHLSQIGLTLGLTFKAGLSSFVGCSLLVAVDDASPGEVVRRELDHHTVLGEDPD